MHTEVCVCSGFEFVVMNWSFFNVVLLKIFCTLWQNLVDATMTGLRYSSSTLGETHWKRLASTVDPLSHHPDGSRARFWFPSTLTPAIMPRVSILNMKLTVSTLCLCYTVISSCENMILRKTLTCCHCYAWLSLWWSLLCL